MWRSSHGDLNLSRSRSQGQPARRNRFRPRAWWPTPWSRLGWRSARHVAKQVLSDIPAKILDQRRNLCCRNRLRDKKALNLRAFLGMQQTQLLDRLDALGRRGNAQTVAHPSDRADDRDTIRLAAEPFDKALVDFDLVERK